MHFEVSGLFLLILVSGCQNPFAPGVEPFRQGSGGPISDQKTIEGVFQNFRYAYTFKDTLIYNSLLAEDFIFVYRDYEKGVDISWGREEELRTTSGLFENSERLDLIWNNIIVSSADSVQANIVRGFNLTITFNPTDILRLDGRVNLFMRKESDGRWVINRWIDESNF